MPTSTSDHGHGSHDEKKKLPFEFEVNGLYILLFKRAKNSWTYHWGLYLHLTTKMGNLYHLVDDGTPGIWRFDPRSEENTGSKESLLAALKIAVLDPSMHRRLLDRLYQVPIADSVRYGEKLTCRVWLKELTCRMWLKEALFALDDEGYITLVKSVESIVQEAIELVKKPNTQSPENHPAAKEARLSVVN
jgi:hypothetical protein